LKVWELKDAFGLENLVLGERRDPKPGSHEVVVAMRAASLNYRDLVIARGAYGPWVKVPLIPLSDGAGEVIAVGDKVTRVAVGDRVAPQFFQTWPGGPAAPEKFPGTLGGPIDGALSELMCVKEDGVARIPDHLSYIEAACLPCAALTAWSALMVEGTTEPGDTVLVQGTGGVALFAMQFAKMVSARVIIISSRDDKLARARQLGADETINYVDTPEWDRIVKDMTDGEGCDHVVELAGGESVDRSVRATRTGGRISLIGVLTGAKAAVTLPLVVMRNLRMQGVTVGSRDAFEEMCRATARHRIHPVIDRVFDFDDAPDAYEHLASGHHFGKVCIRHS